MRKKKQVIAIGVSGMSHRVLRILISRGCVPNIGKMKEHGLLMPMSSLYPLDSHVNWASLVTGTNPGKHGIFGLVERRARSLKLFTPAGKNLKQRPFWGAFSAAGRQVCVLDVPWFDSFPQVNGILIGFNKTRRLVVSYPQSLGQDLQEIDYLKPMWGANGGSAGQSVLMQFPARIEEWQRFVGYFRGLQRWDLLVARFGYWADLLRLYMDQIESDLGPDTKALHRCYEAFDQALAEIVSWLDSDTVLLIFSEQGASLAKGSIDLNAWLVQKGWLQFATATPSSLEDISRESRAYSLVPGRIYLNLAGREPHGSINPLGRSAEDFTDQIIKELMDLRDPESGMSVIREVLRGGRIYQGPWVANSPDLIVALNEGFYFTGEFPDTKNHVEIKGVPAIDEAFLFLGGPGIEGLVLDGGKVPGILDIAPTILGFLHEDCSRQLDGRMLMPSRFGYLEH